MDWYTWLCKTGLDPDFALEYALLFARNELGAADIRHLDHEFLASMGVAVAKHRLEILKLARRETSSAAGKAVAAAITALPRRATRLLAAAVHRSARSVLGRLRSSSSTARGRDRDRDRAALIAAPRLPAPLPARYHRGGGRVAHWNKVASPLATRGGGKLPLPLPMLAHVSKPPILTNSGSKRRNSTTTAPVAIAGCLAAPEFSSCDEADEDDDDDEEDTDDGEDVQWESMFQDLKPT